VRLKNSRQKDQDSKTLGVWATAKGGSEGSGRARLTIREQIKEPGGDQLETNRGVIAAQNCQNMQGGIGPVSIRGLQFGESKICEITPEQLAKAD
jgi:hypothetical protein